MEPRTLPGVDAAEQHRPRAGLLRSLRTKVVASSTLLVVAPGLLIAFLAFSSARQAIDKAVGTQLAEVTGDAADEFVAALASERANLGSWAKNEVMRELLIGDPDKRVTRYLASLREGNDAYADILCVDLGGRAVAATDPRDVGESFASEPWFRAVERGGEAIDGPRSSSRYGRSVLDVAVAIFHPQDPGRKIGFLALVYDWNATREVLAHTRQKRAAFGLHVDLLLLDERSTVIGGSWTPGLGEWTGKNLRAAGWRCIVKPRPTRAAAEEPSIDALVALAPLDDLHSGWRIAGLWRLHDALRPVRTMQRRWTIVILAILV